MFWKKKSKKKSADSDTTVGIKVSDVDLSLDVSNEAMLNNLKSFIDDNIDNLCNTDLSSPLDYYANLNNQRIFSQICDKSLSQYRRHQTQFTDLLEKLGNSNTDTISSRCYTWISDYAYAIEKGDVKKALKSLYKLHILITLLIKMYSVKES